MCGSIFHSNKLNNSFDKQAYVISLFQCSSRSSIFNSTLTGTIIAGLKESTIFITLINIIIILLYPILLCANSVEHEHILHFDGTGLALQGSQKYPLENYLLTIEIITIGLII